MPTKKNGVRKMRLLQRNTLMIIALALLSGCASSDLSQYKKLSSAANTYVTNYVEVIDLTADLTIEATSLEVIDFHLDTSPDKRTKKFLADAGDKFEDSHQQVQNRLIELGQLKAHLNLFRTYFEKVFLFAGNTNAKETGEAIESSGKALNKLVEEISGDGNESIVSDSQVTKLTSLSTYILRLKTQRTLNEVIASDIKFLEENLELHEEAFKTIGNILNTEFSGSSDLRKQFDLVSLITASKRPFTTKRERDQWMKDRREILLTNFNASTLKNTSKASEKFIEALEELASGPSGSTAKLDAFLAEVEALKETVKALRN